MGLNSKLLYLGPYAPLELRNAAGFTDPRTIAAYFNDSAFALCAPSEIIFGPRAQVVGDYFGVSDRHARRAIIPGMDYAYFVGKWVFTVANSIHAHRKDYETAVLTPAERGKMGGRPTKP